jgi:pimeloyl-ACP methyl ester carboxylesterase
MRRELEIRTPDGRRLLAQVAGPADGALILFHAGTPGSRHLYDRHIEEGAARGLRHVCYSRPGCEGSDRHPGRSYASCAADSAAIADALGAETFHVVGQSGGGGHALACAALLADRVLSVAAIAGVAPRRAMGFDWFADAGRSNREEFAAVETGEEALERFIVRCAAELGSVRSAEQFCASLGDLLCEADRACLEGPFLQFQLDGCRRALGDGIWGWFDDDVAIWGEWGFDLDAVTAPVTVWHGEDDRMVPASHGECLARELAADLRLLPGEGHLSLAARNYGEILDHLVTAGEGNVCSPS